MIPISPVYSIKSRKGGIMLWRSTLSAWFFPAMAIIGVIFSAGTAAAATTVSSNITVDTTWTAAGSPYIIAAKDVTVTAGTTLTIDPGVVIKFNSYTYNLLVEGTLNATGTAGQNIIFTEIRDDVGDDTNGDGAASSPAPGYWGHIELNGTGNIMDYVDIRYGGYGSSGQLTINGGGLTLTNSTIQYSSSYGVRIEGSDPVMTDNNYHDNNWAAASMDLSSNPAISGVTVSNNGINGLQVDKGSLTKDGFWDDPDIVYWTAEDITVPVGMTLTVGPGQVVKFGAYWYDLFVNGTLDARGVFAAPIVFTEARDDTAGGDTNNDADTSSPSPGYWGRIELAGSGNIMEHVHMRYGGYGSSGQLTVNGGELAIINSEIRSANSDGLWAGNKAQVEIASSLIHHNADPGIRAESGSLLMATNNTIDENGRGVDIDDAHVILTNNMITNNAWTGVRSAGWSSIEFSHNNVYNPGATNYDNITDPGGGNGNISAAPLYIDPVTFNYELQETSPAIDAGTSDNAPVDDFLFRWRHDHPGTTNTGSGTPDYYDMGAVEYGGTPRVVKHRPEGETIGPVDSIRFIFRNGMDRSSFALADDVAGFTGPHGSLTGSEFSWLNPYVLDVRFSPQYAVGAYQMVIGPNILDESARPMDTDGDLVYGETTQDRYTAAFAVTPPKDPQPYAFRDGERRPGCYTTAVRPPYGPDKFQLGGYRRFHGTGRRPHGNRLHMGRRPDPRNIL